MMSTVPWGWGTLLLSLSVLVLESTCAFIRCKENVDKILEVFCYVFNTQTESWPFGSFNHTESVAWVVLITGFGRYSNCGLPSTSYADTFAALNVDVAGITGLVLHNPEPGLNATHFKGLNLRSLCISNSKNKLELNYLESVTTMTRLDISHANISSLPATTRIENVELSRGASFGAWGGCTDLRELKLTEWDIKYVPNDWLSNCSKLVVMDLSRMKSESMNMFSQLHYSLKSLRSLKIEISEINDMDFEYWIDMVNLERLNLQQNDLQHIPIYDVHSLKELDMSFNKLIPVSFLGKDSLFTVANLTFDYNPHLKFCDVVRRLRIIQTQQLSLRKTNTDLCFGRIQMPKLEFLDLRDNKINTLRFSGLPLTSARLFELDLRDNDIENVELDSSDYAKLEKSGSKMNFTIRTNLSLECGCSDGLLARALRQKLLSVPGAHCRDGRHLAHVPPEQLECNRSTCGNCTCQRSWHGNVVDIYCSARGLLAMPKEPGMRRMYAPDNLIQTFSATDLPDTLVYLDISRNHIARLNASAAAALFSVPQRRVLFAGNPIICHCDNLPLLQALQEHRAQVLDYELIACSDKDHLLRNVSTAELCARVDVGGYSELTVALFASSGVLVALLSILAVLYYRHKSPVKAYLYARGCCLWWLREDEVDADKQYDAFVSFAHQDEEYVVDTLLPGLERAPHAYKLCLHSRDWLIGEWIVAQIMESIEQSRRMIVVLSKNFLESKWGLFEFRTAHLSTLQEGRRRIIVVVLDDVVDDDRLSPELKAYLASNTYLRFDDKRFWDKLVYAIPHRPVVPEVAAVTELEDQTLPTVADCKLQTSEV